MKILKIGLAAVGALILALAVFFSLKTSPVGEPAVYNPPAPPAMSGVTAPNDLLKQAHIIAAGKIHGPEDVDVDSQGRVYGGTMDGKILRVSTENGAEKVEEFAVTGGRPLGMEFDARENLIVADSYKGLISIDPAGKITTLATEAEGIKFKFADDLDIARDGMIYFSDASYKYGQEDYLLDLIEARPYGRLISYNPATKEIKVLLKDLYFANGVALSKNEDFVLVNETYRYRVRRYWLKGVKAGTTDIFIDNLPGIPDGISANRKGRFWLALFTVRNNQIDNMHPSPFMKKLVAKLPRFAWPKPKPYGFVVALDEEGNIVKTLQDKTGEHLKEITSVEEHEGFLYLGSLHNDRIGKIKAPEF